MKVIQQEMVNWETELSNKGYVAEESQLIEALHKESNPQLLSKLLTLTALSRIGRKKQQTLTVLMMEKALELDPTNSQAKEFFIQFEWKKKEHLFIPLSFPSIRETDNRTAKKKIAEEYIHICTVFLEETDEHLKELENNRDIASTIDNIELYEKYQLLSEYLQEAVKIVGDLHKAAIEYDQSITGVFHTSTYYEELKTQLSALEDLKKRWQTVFLEKEPQERKLEKNALDQLNEMIGMEQVKKRVNDFYRFLKYQKHRKEHGFHIKDELILNMVLTGNPGTGKTTIARLLARIYHELGVLPREEVIEVDRAQLVGSYVGQTEENVRAVVERAIGGVLFIDEAYSLKRDGQAGNDYGQTAIDTLVSLMTGQEFGGRFAVILAGYPEEMRSFLDANPGLRSRFPQSNLLHLPNYSNEELVMIAEKIADENDYILTEDAKIEIQHRLEKERVDDTFGNARTVRNIVLDAIFKKGSKENIPEFFHFMILGKEDFLIEKTENMVSPYDKLGRLIGLESLKDEIQSLISFVKMQQYRRKQKLPTVPIQLHAVFTGNPGTGKTTVAQIYAELLRDCGILKRGHLIVASRADFVAGYVGQTASKTKKKIREALGGVLFIDEAYSLLGHSSQDFGKEVIDTLVDEMTKQNENLVVVLAGYPNEMDHLLESNPGLRSRFKKFFLFPDYSPEELLAIMDAYAEGFQYQIISEARELLKDTLDAKKFNGNGRFATNLVDEMIQAQALRLMKERLVEELADQVNFITPEDVTVALKKIEIK
ncbi:AAA family ATPase [Bacillus salipaludis]|uniref:AAA family ATPase n=1 Tax=Bacillus salipaludis TaxID=2547811 RepID=A0A4R5VMH9_9BACI|nr:AAA family ATPase [Bacillus salipaludis]MDQ6598285.1 AAA family ATPase [Bacillus salipaludis]TDK59344.1 AAA family ATPase [Bacillus salipaludis]